MRLDDRKITESNLKFFTECLIKINLKILEMRFTASTKFFIDKFEVL